MKREPKIHSRIESALDYSPLSYKKYCKSCDFHGWLKSHDSYDHDLINCDTCKDILHLGTENKCLRTWVETGKGNFCLKCFVLHKELLGTYGCQLRDDWGLDEEVS